jgi:hypothetical protein
MAEHTLTRLYTGLDGESHFGQVSVALLPGAMGLSVSSQVPAGQYVFAEMAESGEGETLHPTPRRQLAIVLSGQVEVTASDGQVHRRGPGEALLMEDTTGKGHTSRPIGGPARTLIVQLT